jgi:hypothetical protein
MLLIQMARAVMEAFPEFPKMNFSTKRRAMEEARRDMALQVLESSGIQCSIHLFLNNLKAFQIYSD